MSDLLTAILGLGLLGAACLAFTEKILPVPPSHAVLLFLGMARAPDLATLGMLLAVTTAASTAGCLFWFAMGGRLGPARADALIQRFGRYIFLRHETYLRFASAYRRNHMRASLLAQFVPTVRNYLPIAAGALRLPAWSFALATLLGAMLWNAGFLLAGYAMRDGVHDLPTVAFRIMAVVLALEVAFLIALRAYWRRVGPARG
ncbi:MULTISPECIES: DedA family protein [unclassified Mesorhizobium]|uniref:DedA family protein n=1 Tax=unclassified Mesorhizobium TaxID=325217 RepID=UPI00112744A0|nr:MULTISPECIES: DedA family protein [unclassified Mesorhizobium]TPK92724.1 DedA family protein [Mesorhizobium sp. B2-4-16]TPL73067.1 DedA family protein [Mesorhizobium sp. B2-4-3]